MSAQNPPAHRQFDDNEEERPEPDAEELRLLEEHLDQLEKEGVLIKGDGIRGSLQQDEAVTINTSGHESVEKSDELRQLFKQLAELRAKGIISGGDGPRDSLKPTAHVPGALARFLADGR
jgi:hypothetical protein